MDGHKPTTPAGRAVARRRAELHLTQEDLAEAAGVSRRTIQSLEHGERVPLLENLIAIEQALQWPPGKLLSLTEAGQAPDTWKEVRRLLVKALAADTTDQMRDVIADALVALGRADDPEPGSDGQA